MPCVPSTPITVVSAASLRCRIAYAAIAAPIAAANWPGSKNSVPEAVWGLSSRADPEPCAVTELKGQGKLK
jgi:hypothetical protein